MSRTSPTIIRRATTKPNILDIPTYPTSCLRSVAPLPGVGRGSAKDTLAQLRYGGLSSLSLA
jgi:hypothetical protein